MEKHGIGLWSRVTVGRWIKAQLSDFIRRGRRLRGFAVVAWRAEYGNSGVMTFVMNYTRDVYQKDPGEQTDKLARTMTDDNPDSTWKKAE
jgi:hypothetical protein